MAAWLRSRDLAADELVQCVLAPLPEPALADAIQTLRSFASLEEIARGMARGLRPPRQPFEALRANRVSLAELARAFARCGDAAYRAYVPEGLARAGLPLPAAIELMRELEMEPREIVRAAFRFWQGDDPDVLTTTIRELARLGALDAGLPRYLLWDHPESMDPNVLSLLSPTRPEAVSNPVGVLLSAYVAADVPLNGVAEALLDVRRYTPARAAEAFTDAKVPIGKGLAALTAAGVGLPRAMSAYYANGVDCSKVIASWVAEASRRPRRSRVVTSAPTQSAVVEAEAGAARSRSLPRRVARTVSQRARRS